MIRGVAVVFGVLAILILLVIGGWILWWVGSRFIHQYERWKSDRDIAQLQKMAGGKPDDRGKQP